MQDKSIQRLRYRLRSIGCTEIKLSVHPFYVFACFNYYDEYYRVRIPFSLVDSYPKHIYKFNFD